MKKQFKLSIPKPCHEDWSKMTQREKGRFCQSCSKTVVDFTKRSREEIDAYLKQHQGTQVCGHFKREQLDTITLEIPDITFERQLSFQNLFLLALLMVMGTTLFSCQNPNGKKQKIDNVILIDSTPNGNPIMTQKQLDSIVDELLDFPVTLPINIEDQYYYIGAAHYQENLPPLFNKNFHLDSIIEMEEEEGIVIEDMLLGEVSEEIIEMTGMLDPSSEAVYPEFSLDSIVEVEEEETFFQEPTESKISGGINFEPDTEECFVFGYLIEVPAKFPKADSLSPQKAQEDFNKRITSFFQENFKTPKADNDLKSGKYRLYAQFMIDTLGRVTEIKIKAPHPTLQHEVERVLNKLPTFIPAEQRGKAIKTKYTLPIKIDIE